MSNKSDRYVTIVFLAVVGLMVVAGCLDFVGAPRGTVDAIVMPVAVLSVVLLVLHGSRMLGLLRLTGLVATAATTGFIFEFFGVRGGTVFGGQYFYDEAQYENMMLLGVPIPVIVFWAVFIYVGYCITNSFVRWMGKAKPAKAHGNAHWIALLVLLDGMAVMAFDLFMDPIVVHRGGWVWAEQGAYFGIPIGNFIGWFLVTVIATSIFRGFEYFAPKESPSSSDFVHLIPVLGYGIVGVMFTIHAAKEGMPGESLAGFAVMMPFVLTSLVCFMLRGSE